MQRYKLTYLIVMSIYRKIPPIIIIGLLLLTQGCPIIPQYGHPDSIPPHLIQIPDEPNTFRMVIPDGLFSEPKDWISQVRVIDFDEAHNGNINIYWEIKAKKRIPARDFEIEIGQVPEGFEQVFPETGLKFTPVPGKEYYIGVKLEIYQQLDWIQTSFKINPNKE